MLLKEKTLGLIAGLQGRYGRSFAKERSKRAMLARHYGEVPGERSISRVERKLEKEGRLRRQRVLPGGRLPNGACTRTGTVLVSIITRQERRAVERARRKAAARKPSPPPRPEPRPHRDPPASSHEPTAKPASIEEVHAILKDAGMEWLLTGTRRRPPPDR